MKLSEKSRENFPVSESVRIWKYFYFYQCSYIYVGRVHQVMNISCFYSKKYSGTNRGTTMVHHLLLASRI